MGGFDVYLSEKEIDLLIRILRTTKLSGEEEKIKRNILRKLTKYDDGLRLLERLKEIYGRNQIKELG